MKINFSIEIDDAKVMEMMERQSAVKQQQLGGLKQIAQAFFTNLNVLRNPQVQQSADPQAPVAEKKIGFYSNPILVDGEVESFKNSTSPYGRRVYFFCQIYTP